ncbi:MAG: FAD-binding protein [Eubacteriales bacterium]|nr:FAD-binding protein [Clostridiales bacterium]MDY5836888.1 FAD-binding protein [Eubacteriales bacterium]
MDEKGLTQAPLAQGWSQDNLAEVAAGKIIKADSLEALAQAIKLDPADLEDQFADYQSFCQDGWDSQFGRRPQNLLPLEENGPYYAIPLTPVLEATLGGPRRNTACQVLDTKGEIIPRLYSAGSLGSFFPNLFPQGADLSEAVITGQIAGVNALKNK